VENAASNERVGIGALEPGEQILHQSGDAIRRRSEVDDAA